MGSDLEVGGAPVLDEGHEGLHVRLGVALQLVTQQVRHSRRLIVPAGAGAGTGADAGTGAGAGAGVGAALVMGAVL